MFRTMRRFKQQVSEEECLRILTEEKRAVLSVIGENGYPYAIPVNHFYNPEDGRIYFHCAKAGHKIDAIKACEKVCLTTWNKGFQKEGEWAWNVTSVVVFGRAEFVADDDVKGKETALLGIGNKFYSSEEEVYKEIEDSRKTVQLVAITIDHMTGKLVNEA